MKKARDLRHHQCLLVTSVSVGAMSTFAVDELAIGVFATSILSVGILIAVDVLGTVGVLAGNVAVLVAGAVIDGVFTTRESWDVGGLGETGRFSCLLGIPSSHSATEHPIVLLFSVATLVVACIVRRDFRVLNGPIPWPWSASTMTMSPSLMSKPVLSSR
jgi:hypothetical protein